MEKIYIITNDFDNQEVQEINKSDYIDNDEGFFVSESEAEARLEEIIDNND